MIQFILRLIPPWGWLGIGAAAISAAIAWHLYDRQQAVTSAVDAVHAEYHARALEQEALNRAEEERRAKLAKEADNENLARIRKAEKSAAAARSELGKLRQLLAGRGAAAPGSPAASSPDGTGITGLFSECAGAVQDLAAEAGRLAGKVTGLQRYVKDQCSPHM